MLVSDANVLAPAVLAIPELLPLAASIRNVETLMSAFDPLPTLAVFSRLLQLKPMHSLASNAGEACL